MYDTQIQNDKDSIFVILKLFEREQAYTVVRKSLLYFVLSISIVVKYGLLLI